MSRALAQQPSSPKWEFEKAIESLKVSLADPGARFDDIANGFVELLGLMECIPVGKPVHAAAKAVVVSSFRVICHEMLEGHIGMGIRRAAIKDIDMHCKKVLLYAWL